MPKTKSSRSKLLKYLLVFGLFLGVTSRIVYLKMVKPSGINEVSSGWVATKSDLMIDPATGKQVTNISEFRDGMKLANGCVAQQVQCIQAPCPPIWKCPVGVTPPPVESRMCTQEAGSCVTTSGQCSGYTDGCMKAKICANPYQQCGITKPTPSSTPQSCVTMPSCPAGKVCPMVALQRDQVYCSPKPTPTTIPANCTSWFDGCNTCSVENGVIKACTKIACKDSTKPASCLAYTVPAPSVPPSCSCPPGAMCKLSAECNRPSPSPVATGLGSFSATKACGANSFASVTYSCQKDKSLITLSNGDCIDMYSALKKAISYCGTVVSGVNAK